MFPETSKEDSSRASLPPNSEMSTTQPVATSGGGSGPAAVDEVRETAARRRWQTMAERVSKFGEPGADVEVLAQGSKDVTPPSCLEQQPAVQDSKTTGLYEYSTPVGMPGGNLNRSLGHAWAQIVSGEAKAGQCQQAP